MQVRRDLELNVCNVCADTREAARHAWLEPPSPRRSTKSAGRSITQDLDELSAMPMRSISRASQPLASMMLILCRAGHAEVPALAMPRCRPWPCRGAGPSHAEVPAPAMPRCRPRPCPGISKSRDDVPATSESLRATFSFLYLECARDVPELVTKEQRILRHSTTSIIDSGQV